MVVFVVCGCVVLILVFVVVSLGLVWEFVIACGFKCVFPCLFVMGLGVDFAVWLI